MATKEISGQKKIKERTTKSKKETIQKLNQVIDSSLQDLNINVEKISINTKKSAISDIKNKPQENKIKDMSINKTKEVSPIIVTQSQSTKEDDDRLDNTEVYDEGDLASAYERGFIQDALNKHKEKLAPETHPDFDGETCIDCGTEIPAIRLSMGRIRCVDCQNKLEKRKKLYA